MTCSKISWMTWGLGMLHTRRIQIWFATLWFRNSAPNSTGLQTSLFPVLQLAKERIDLPDHIHQPSDMPGPFRMCLWFSIAVGTEKKNTATCRRSNIDCYIDVITVQAIFKIVLSKRKIFHVLFLVTIQISKKFLSKQHNQIENIDLLVSEDLTFQIAQIQKIVSSFS